MHKTRECAEESVLEQSKVWSKEPEISLKQLSIRDLSRFVSVLIKVQRPRAAEGVLTLEQRENGSRKLGAAVLSVNGV